MGDRRGSFTVNKILCCYWNRENGCGCGEAGERRRMLRQTDDYASQRERLLDWSSKPSGSNTTARGKHCCCAVAALITGAKVLIRRAMRKAEETRVRSNQLTKTTKRKKKTKKKRCDSYNCCPLTSCNWLYSVWPVVTAGKNGRKKGSQAICKSSLAVIHGGINVIGNKVLEKWKKKRIQSQRQLDGPLFSDYDETIRWSPRRPRGNTSRPNKNLWNKILPLHLSVSLFAEHLLHGGWSQSGPYNPSEYLSLWDKLKLLFMALIYESVK